MKGLSIARIHALLRNPSGKEKAGHARAHDDQIIILVGHVLSFQYFDGLNGISSAFTARV
jgi:hypothetical protein